MTSNTFPPDPVGQLSQATSDPFDCLPARLEPSDWRRLTFWLDAGGSKEKERYRAQVARLRKVSCFRYAQDSAAAIHAAMALIALNDGAGEQDERWRRHQAVACACLTTTLSTLDTRSAKSAGLAIFLLMALAHIEHDKKILRSHFAGLTAVITQRPALLTEMPYTAGLINSWALAYSRHGMLEETDHGLLFQWVMPAGASRSEPGSSLAHLQDFSDIDDGLVAAGWNVVELINLKRRAETGFESARHVAAVLRCTWTVTVQLEAVASECTTAFERAVRYALMMVLTVELGPATTTYRLHQLGLALLRQLSQINKRWLVRHSAQAALWMAMLAAPYADEIHDDFVDGLLARAAQRLSIETYGQARDICGRLAWSSKYDRSAVPFWVAMVNSCDQHTVTVPKATHPANARKCALCGQTNCAHVIRRDQEGTSYEIYEVPEHMKGMLWAARVSDFRSLCRVESFEDE